MKPPHSDRVDEFVNAVQLCISSRVSGVIWDSSKETLSIGFESAEEKDEKLAKIKRLLPLEEGYELGFKIKLDFFKSDVCKKLTTFLLLTRLEDRNIQKLAELDAGYATFLSKLGLKEKRVSHINNLKDAALFIFKFVENRQLTLRELSHKTGLTQAALSNFKSGKSDIRLSSFLKITSALGLSLKVQ